MNRLPQLVLEQIFENLNVRDLCSTRLVCSKWNQLFLWKMKFSNSNFLKALQYISLQTKEQMELFLCTFGRAETPIPFPRFLWNVHVGTDAQAQAFGTLYANCIVELCVNDVATDDIMVDVLPSNYLVFDKAGLVRISALLHKVSHSLEVLQISIQDFWPEQLRHGNIIHWKKLEQELDDISVPLLPRLSILDIACDCISHWVKAVVRNAPALEFFIPQPCIFYYGRNSMPREFGTHLQDLGYDPERSEVQEYSKRWFDANARRIKLQLFAVNIVGIDTTSVRHRVWKDQIKNIVAIDSSLPHDALALFDVFPRVRSLRTTAVTWLENPLKLLSSTQLPQLKLVVLSENATVLTAQDFPAALSYVYPNVVEFHLEVKTNPERTYTPLPYYKLFPNVTKLQFDNEATRNLIGLFKYFVHVRCLAISYYTLEQHDFDLECGAKPHVASFEKLERLEYINMNGREDIFSKLVSSAKSLLLTSLKDVYFWHNIHPGLTWIRSDLVRRLGGPDEIRNYLKEREIHNVEQVQQYYKVQWWITVADDEKVV